MLTSSVGHELASLDWLTAHHGAKLVDRQKVINALDIDPGSAVLDVACGPCFWSELLAAKIGSSGWLYSLDLNLSLLTHGKDRITKDPTSAPISLVRGNFEQLPFRNSSLDAVFFCNGLAYAREPLRAVQEQKRVIRPGGSVIGRHWDNSITVFHPVPSELLLEIQLGAARALSNAKYPQPFNNYFGQRLPGIFGKAGFQEIHTTTQAIQFLPPLGTDVVSYLTAKAHWFAEKARPFIKKKAYQEWLRLFTVDCSEYILQRDDFYFCTVEVETIGLT